MNPPLTFEKSQIAACGMNCGTCIGFLRTRNRCPGCRVNVEKPVTRVRCIVKNCDNLKETSSGYCYDCGKFPCKRIVQLDKRYRTKYNTSFIENLEMIRDKGMESFLRFEGSRRNCPECGYVLSVHKKNCLFCNMATN
jgi:hypothetical protein